MANGLISWVTGVHLHDYGCTLKAYRREVITGFRLYGEDAPLLLCMPGRWAPPSRGQGPSPSPPARQSQLRAGTTFKVVLDLLTVKFLTSFASKPIYVFGGGGLA